MNKDVQKINEAYGNVKYNTLLESKDYAKDGDVFVLPNGKKVVYYADLHEDDDDRYYMHILVDQETNETFAYLKSGNGVDNRGSKESVLKSTIQDRLDNSEVSMNLLNTPVI